jgi:fibronectin-binding autotransporter adhesin
MSLNGGRVEIREGTSNNTDTTAPGLQIGRDGATGTVLVDGSGSVLAITQTSIDAGFGGPFMQVGRGVGGVGDVTISNGGVVELAGESSSLVVGNRDGGQGTIDILSGGALMMDGLTGSAGMSIATHTTSQGAVTVDGVGSLLSITSATNAGLTVGQSGTGSLDVTGGAGVNLTNAGLNVGDFVGANGSMTVSGAGSTLTMTSATLNFATIGFYATGSLDITDGASASFTNVNVDLGVEAGANGSLIVSGAGSTLTTDQVLHVGFEGAGSLTVSDGGAVTSSALGVQFGAAGGGSGTGTVTGAGSTLDVSGFFAVGQGFGGVSPGAAATGTLDILAGGTVNSATGLRLGGEANATGDVTVEGAGSALNATDGLEVGVLGSGSLTVSDGAAVALASDNFNNLLVGSRAGGVGLVTITGPGSSVVTSGQDNVTQIGFASGSTGTLLVENGGEFKTLQFEIARDGTGTATVTGAGSTIIVSNDEGRFSGFYDYEAGFARIGRNAGSDATLNILDGGRFEVRDGDAASGNDDTSGPWFQVARDLGSVGTVLVDGAGSVLDVSAVGPADGPYGVGPGMNVGRGGTGTLTVSNGAAANISGESIYLAVGQNAGSDGTLNILSGGSMTFNGVADFANMRIGQSAGSIGRVTIDGAGSTLDVTNQGANTSVVVGVSGSGTLDILAGGVMNFAGDQIGVGTFSGGTGALTVDGAGSALNVNGDLGIGSSFSNGSLAISNGGAVDVNAVNGLSVVGVATVDGVGSTLSVASVAPSYSWIGADGVGSLDITGGASASFDNSNIQLGSFPGSDGTVSVSGTGSTLDVSFGNLWIGHMGTGDMLVDGGGSVVIDSGGYDPAIPADWGDYEDLIVGGTAAGVGSLTISGAGSRVETRGVDNLVRIGHNGGDGTLLVEDGGTLDTYFFEVGRNAGSVGVATVTGAGSTIIVSSENGTFYAPYDYEAGFARVGRDGADATLNVLNGGRVEIREGATNNTDSTAPGLQIGRDGATGTVLVDGSGSVLAITQTSIDAGFGGPFMQVGRGVGGVGEITISNGGVVELAGESSFVVVGNRDDGQGTIDILSGGSLTIDGVTGYAGMTLASHSATQGAVNVDGVGSMLSVTSGTGGSVGIGQAGTGSLDVTGGAGASFTNVALDVGIDAGANGSVVVSGAGSSLNVTSAVQSFNAIGLSGTGSFDITGGADASFVNGNINVGLFAGADGSLVVSGAGSTLTTDQAFHIGFEGSGSLTVGAGAIVTSSAEGLQFGAAGGGSGSGTVTGAGSTLDVSGFFAVGQGFGGATPGAAATGTLDILAGGTVNSATGLRLGGEANATGDVTVDGAGSALNATDGLEVGVLGSGSLTVSDGAAVALASDNFNNLLVGSQAGGVGSVTITGPGSSVVTSGQDNVTQIGAVAGAVGTLLVENGGQLKSLQFEAGRDGTGTATVTGAGSIIIVSNDDGRFGGYYDYEAGFARVGRDGDGTLNILDGGRFEVRAGVGVNEDTSVPFMQIGRNASSTSTVLVDGSGSILDIFSLNPPGGPFTEGPGLQVGREGTATLTVSNGGEARVNGQGATLTVGARVGGDGTVTVTGPGSSVEVDAMGVGGFVSIGNLGTGALNVLAGGSASLSASGLAVGGQPGASGSVTVSGLGSTFDVVSPGIDDVINIGTAGAGSIDVLAGGSASLSAEDISIGGPAGSAGSVTVSGVGSTLDVNATFDSSGLIGIGGSLDVLAGAVVNLTGGHVLFDNTELGLTGNVVVDGAGSVLTVTTTNTFAVGNLGDATLMISNGGVVNSTVGTRMHIADQLASTGVVTVTGAGSQFTSDAEVVVGGGWGSPAPGLSGPSVGTLTILDGGHVAAPSMILGELEMSDGSVTVSGVGSTMTVAGRIHVGMEGVGALTIDSGGVVTSATDGLLFGAHGGGSGTGTVTGAGSTLDVTGFFAVGYGFDGPDPGDAADGSLDVLAGGTVNSANDLFVGGDENSVGTMTVDGAGSTVNALGQFVYVGSGAGDGTLTVSNGGQVNAFQVDVGANGTLTGDGGTIDGTVFVTGTVAPGASLGTLSATGSVLLEGGTFDIEIGAGGAADQINAGGLLDLANGVVEISFLDGFLPSAGQTIQFGTGVTVGVAANNVSLVVSGVAATGFAAPTLSTSGTDASVTFSSALSAGNSSHFFSSNFDDLFVFDDNGGADTVTNFTAGAGTADVLDLTAFGFADFTDLLNSASQVVGDTVIDLDGVDDSVTLLGINVGNLDADDFLI